MIDHRNAMSETRFCEPYIFPQPIGLWKRRGASDVLVELATGHLLLSGPDFNPNCLQPDQDGYGVWHYWAQSPNPEKTWAALRKLVGASWDKHLSVAGEHPMHRLLLKNNIEAAKLWADTAFYPKLNGVGHETLWHHLAWGGDGQSVAEVHEFLDTDNINIQDDYGMTAAVVSVHRGGKNALQQFLMLGADPDIPDEHHRVILHHVAQYGDISWFTEVQDLGAADDVKNDKGQTPIDVLKERMKHGTQTDIDILKMHWQKRYFQKTMF